MTVTQPWEPSWVSHCVGTWGFSSLISCLCGGMVYAETVFNQSYIFTRPVRKGETGTMEWRMNPVSNFYEQTQRVKDEIKLKAIESKSHSVKN